MNTLERYYNIQNKLKKLNETLSLVWISKELSDYNIQIKRQTLWNYIHKDKKKIYSNDLKNIEDLEIFFESLESLNDKNNYE